MDQHQAITKVPVMPLPKPAPSWGIFGTGIPSAIAFAAALLLFLLPFAAIFAIIRMQSSKKA